MRNINLSLADNKLGKMLRIAVASALVLASLTPLLASQNASAAQITSRKVTVSSSELGQTNVDYDFDFTIPTAGAIQGIVLEFCTTAVGACTDPAGTFDVSGASVTAQTFTNATVFAAAAAADENDCLMSGQAGYTFCVERAEVTSENADAKSLTIDGVTNLDSEDTVYVRIRTYSDTAFATKVDEGVVALATVNQITTTGRVQENLDFCVAAIDDAAAEPTTPALCIANFNDTTVDIGVIDNTTVAKSPVETTATNGSDDDYGIAMINTNASGGISVTFFSETAGSGTNQLAGFRVTGANCNASDATLTDQCFRPAANSGTTLSSGDGERFGIHVPCVDLQGVTTALTGTAEYDNEGSTADAADCENEAGNDFAWWDGATADEIASSTGPVDREIVKIRFGAIASPTTPTGSYTVTTTYIATPTF